MYFFSLSGLGRGPTSSFRDFGRGARRASRACIDRRRVGKTGATQLGICHLRSRGSTGSGGSSAPGFQVRMNQPEDSAYAKCGVPSSATANSPCRDCSLGWHRSDGIARSLGWHRSDGPARSLRVMPFPRQGIDSDRTGGSTACKVTLKSKRVIVCSSRPSPQARICRRGPQPRRHPGPHCVASRPGWRRAGRHGDRQTRAGGPPVRRRDDAQRRPMCA